MLSSTKFGYVSACWLSAENYGHFQAMSRLISNCLIVTHFAQIHMHLAKQHMAKISLLQSPVPVTTCKTELFTSAVYNLLTSPDCLPDLLHGGLAEQGVTELFLLATFRLQPRTGTSVFGLYNPQDNSKYFEFTIMGKLNKGEHVLMVWKQFKQVFR